MNIQHLTVLAVNFTGKPCTTFTSAFTALGVEQPSRRIRSLLGSVSMASIDRRETSDGGGRSPFVVNRTLSLCLLDVTRALSVPIEIESRDTGPNPRIYIL
jgi:hypothetical protein